MHAYLLRSLLVCGRCERRLIGSWTTQGGRYGCAARYPRYAPGACDGRSIMAQSVEAVVWDHVKALLADPAVLQTHEFIPLSFWYDAPLISRDSDRRHDP